ncbi:MAG: cobalt ECF transporter T component CbiQ [Candidatus Omnitrophica bacterium]|nr:cobalt ECF transporter T component CbiQ [Candidatus Omnitrophota bacterium]
MHKEQLYKGDSIIHSLDPRLRIVCAVFFSISVAIVVNTRTAVSALLIAVVCVLMAKLDIKVVGDRIKKLNFIMAAVILLFIVSFEGKAVHFSPQGFSRGLLIVLKSNAIVLFLTASLATIELTTIGHALHHLRVPNKLVHIFLFTIRYLGVLHQEYERLIKAMKIRGFIPKMNIHTYKSLANLLGMLLVKAIDRSERIVAAMKCRGFSGKFFILRHFIFHKKDFIAAAIMAGFVLLIIGVDRL